MVNFSFEVFPPKKETQHQKFLDMVKELAQFNPSFISVTSTAHDENDQHTQDITSLLKNEVRVPLASHLICCNKTKEQITQIALNYWKKGIHHIVALRGDLNPPAYKSDFSYANELVTHLKNIRNFEISVAGYPETHFESPTVKSDLDFLKKKVDAGADRIISQFFFDPDIFLKFRDNAIKAGINVPIVPGILPILNFKGLTEFAIKCQSTVPNFLHKMFHNLDKNSLDHKLLAMNVLSHQITKLMENDVQDFHIYTLNHSELNRHVCHWLRNAF